jgi:hypothetical protein
MPDKTLTIHLLWQTLTINNCSPYVKSFKSSEICPTQRPFATASIGIFLFSRDSIHMGQALLQPGAKMGPSNSLTGSELWDLAFLVTPLTFSKLTFSTSESSFISQIGDNFPQTAQPASSHTLSQGVDSGLKYSRHPSHAFRNIDLVKEDSNIPGWQVFTLGELHSSKDGDSH